MLAQPMTTNRESEGKSFYKFWTFHFLEEVLLSQQKMANIATGTMRSHDLVSILKLPSFYTECHKSLRPGGCHLCRHMLHVCFLFFHS